MLITHGHGDHVGGFNSIVDRYDPETWVPEQTEFDAGHRPERRYGDGDRIGRFEAVHVPGHGPDNHTLVDEDASIEVMGDAISEADQRGLPVRHFHLPPAVYSQDLNEAEASLERLLAHEFDVGLVYRGSSVLEDVREKLDRYANFPGKP